jgi:hypothetical protein
MMRLICAVGLSGALAISACSSSSGNSGAGGSGGSADGGRDAATDAPAGVMISGTAAPHPLTMGLDPTAATTQFNMINVAVVDPYVVISNPAAPPLAGKALDISSTNCSATTGCAWSFDNVDISQITLGLVGILDDQRTTGRVWVKTGTGAGAGDFVMMHAQTKEPITNRPLFAVSTMSEAKLAAFAAAALSDATIVAGSLTGRGFMIGSILGKQSAGAMPVAGATLTPADPSKVKILYPSADFMSAGTSTSATGTVLVVPNASPATAIPVVTQWAVTPPTGDTRTWTALTAGSTPGTAFVILFAANE